MKLYQHFEFGPASQDPFSFCQIQLALDTVRQPERALLQGHQQVDEVPDTGDEHFQNNCEKDAVKGWTR
jgi:hypothetical protein